MDHRFSIRTPLRIPVEVFKRERLLGRYLTRNMDIEGVFIEMPGPDLEANEVVRLIFDIPGRPLCDSTLTAGVVRIDADGVGMMIFDHDYRALDVLRAADLSRQAPARRQRRA